MLESTADRTGEEHDVTAAETPAGVALEGSAH